LFFTGMQLSLCLRGKYDDENTWIKEAEHSKVTEHCAVSIFTSCTVYQIS